MEKVSLTPEQTRNKSYREIEDLPAKNKIVFQCIKLHHPISSQDIQKLLGWPINMITGRVEELRDNYVRIKQAGISKNPVSNRDVCLWTVFDSPEERMEAIYRRRRELVEQIEEMERSGHGLNEGAALDLIKSNIAKLKKKLSKVESL